MLLLDGAQLCSTQVFRRVYDIMAETEAVW